MTYKVTIKLVNGQEFTSNSSKVIESYEKRYVVIIYENKNLVIIPFENILYILREFEGDEKWLLKTLNFFLH